MFSIDVQCRVPIYEQIINQIERFIATGILKSNEQLPSVRQMAFDLGINPNTIQRAYTELERKGVIVSIVGKGSFVTDNIQSIIDKKRNEVVIRIKDDINILKNLGLSNKEIHAKIFKD
ncbi:MAG: GntR family transcriptional regulator [Bacilli bacterium]|nr:GntR family transcriptional regulator [Bacilli bacterium]MDD3304706.1 GntR family transcriptional regulator [Bacilli bacterium]MDD4053615.1 GntR family transcriptional regulator [Bacilli bacterium]MDD4411114.1 GntR family transcriptional regulator [Bacilli bacterium]